MIGVSPAGLATCFRRSVAVALGVGPGSLDSVIRRRYASQRQVVSLCTAHSAAGSLMVREAGLDTGWVPRDSWLTRPPSTRVAARQPLRLHPLAICISPCGPVIQDSGARCRTSLSTALSLLENTGGPSHTARPARKATTRHTGRTCALSVDGGVAHLSALRPLSAGAQHGPSGAEDGAHGSVHPHAHGWANNGMRELPLCGVNRHAGAVRHPVAPSMPVGAAAIASRLRLATETGQVAINDLTLIEGIEVFDRGDWSELAHGVHGLLGGCLGFVWPGPLRLGSYARDRAQQSLHGVQRRGVLRVPEAIDGLLRYARLPHHVIDAHGLQQLSEFGSCNHDPDYESRLSNAQVSTMDKPD
jgi:hypothetical protein